METNTTVMSPEAKAKELLDEYKEFANSICIDKNLCKELLESAVSLIIGEIMYEISIYKKISWIVERRGGEETTIYWLQVRNEFLEMFKNEN